jgi:hypothetical protein
MATADESGGLRRLRGYGTVLIGILVVAAALAIGRWRAGAHDTSVRPVRVESTPIETFDSLLTMGQQSDLVIEGTVLAVERGRLVGDPSGTAIVSRLVTVRIEHVFAGSDAGRNRPGAVLIVEEEGWLDDGTPLLVDEVDPSTVGLRALWFLTDIDVDETPTYVVISSQGRFDRVGNATDSVDGGLDDDPLVAFVETLSYAELVDTMHTLAPLLETGP